MRKGLKLFITYAHKNSEAKDQLITYSWCNEAKRIN